MTSIKKRLLVLSSGKKIKLTGPTLCISPTLEVGEGFTRNILGYNDGYVTGSTQSQVSNPYNLTASELAELADFNINLWMQLKDRIREKGIGNPDIFRRMM